MLKMCWLQLLMILLFGSSYVLLMALVGLFLGIKMPTLTWTNEIMPIKQGGAVIITLLCGFVYMIVLFAGFMLLSGWRLGFCRWLSRTRNQLDEKRPIFDIYRVVGEDGYMEIDICFPLK